MSTFPTEACEEIGRRCVRDILLFNQNVIKEIRDASRKTQSNKDIRKGLPKF